MTHYYGKIGVAIVDLSGTLRVGDTIKIEGNRNEIEQAVDSMEMDHDSVKEAHAGDVIGLKVKERVNEGAAIYTIE